MVLIHSDGSHQCPVCGLIQRDVTHPTPDEARQLELALQEVEVGGDYAVPPYSYTAD